MGTTWYVRCSNPDCRVEFNSTCTWCPVCGTRKPPAAAEPARCQCGAPKDGSGRCAHCDQPCPTPLARCRYCTKLETVDGNGPATLPGRPAMWWPEGLPVGKGPFDQPDPLR